MHQLATWRAVQSSREVIGKADEQTTLHRFAHQRLVAHIQTFFSGNAQKLLENGLHLTRCLTVDAEAAATIKIVIAALCFLPHAHENEKIRLGFSADQFFTRIHLLFVSAQQVTSLSQRRDQSHSADTAMFLSREQHACVAWM